MCKIVSVFFIVSFLVFGNLFAIDRIGKEVGATSSDLANMAVNDDPQALFELGFRYANGLGFDKDNVEAFNLFLRSARLGYAKAQYNVALYYDDVYEVQDYKDAAKCYNMALNQSSDNPQYNFDSCYVQERVVPINYKAAAKWYRLAAEQGITEAQVNLGNLYYAGKGIPQDSEKAYFWWYLAYSTGNSEIQKVAAINRDMVAKELNPKHVSHVELKAHSWLDKHK